MVVLIMFLLIFAIGYYQYRKTNTKKWFNNFDWKSLYLIKLKLQLMNDREFEFFIAELFNLLGYRCNITNPTRDGGYDIEAVDRDGNVTLIECKLYDKEKDSVVGRPIAQKLVGAMEYYKKHTKYKVSAAIVTTSEFTSDCVEYCKEMGIEMINIDGILSLVEQVGTDKVLLAAGIYSVDVRNKTGEQMGEPIIANK